MGRLAGRGVPPPVLPGGVLQYSTGSHVKKTLHETHLLSDLSLSPLLLAFQSMSVVRSNQKGSKSVEEAQRCVVSILLSDVLPVIS